MTERRPGQLGFKNEAALSERDRRIMAMSPLAKGFIAARDQFCNSALDEEARLRGREERNLYMGMMQTAEDKRPLGEVVLFEQWESEQR